jgi:hypothetical protein
MNRQTEPIPDIRSAEDKGSLYLLDDGRVNIPYFEVDIVRGCNLECEYCTHFSPYRKGIIPAKHILHWFQTWRKKIHPEVIHILGGEPLLHPDLAMIIRESRRIWDGSSLGIVTNGLHLPKVSQDVLNALKESHAWVQISDHSGTDVPFDKVACGIPRLEKAEISYTLRPANKDWYAQYQYNAEGIPIPFQNPPQCAWEICISKNCPLLMNNRLYKCSVLASILEGVQEGALSAGIWKAALSYKPLSPDAEARTILKHLTGQEVKECCICPGQKAFIEPRQIER